MTDKLNEIFELPQTNPEKPIKTKKSKKELEEDNDDFLKSIQALINSKKPKEESNKRKYERKKPSTEKKVDDEYKEKLRKNLEIARSKRHLLKKGVSPKEEESQKPKDTFIKTEEEIKEPVKEPIEKPHLLEKGVSPKEEKPVEKVIEKVVHKVIEKPHLLEKGVSPKEEKPIEKVIEKSFDNVKPIERYSTINKPPWFKKLSWMK